MAQPVNLTERTNYSVTLSQELIPDRCANPTRKLQDGTIVEMPPITIYCSDCGRRKVINPSCGKRNCKRCQSKRARKLENKYLPAIMSAPNKPGHMWTFVNLTGVHFTVDFQSLGDILRRFGNAMQRFLSEEYEEVGLAVIEHTRSFVPIAIGSVLEGDFQDYTIDGPATIIEFRPQLYIHGHALCYGGYKNKAQFEERWGRALVKAGLLTYEEFKKERDNAIEIHPHSGYERVEGLRYVGIEALRNPRKSVRYILKYVAKGVELSDEYLEALKRLKYIRSWGSLYGMKELTYDLICQDCGGKCYFTLDEGQIIEYFGDKAEPLKFKRVPREVTGPP